MIRSISILALTFFTVLSISNSVQASENLWQHQLGVRAGVLGGSIEYAYSLSPAWVVRINWQKGRYDSSPSSTPAYYDEELDLESMALLFDWHPWYNSFRMSFGVVTNDNEVKGKAVNNSELKVGASTYSSVQLEALSYQADYQDAALYFGLGWGLVPGHYKRWSWTLDAGIYIQQKPKVTRSALIGVGADPVQLQQDLDQELAAVGKDLDDRKLMPTVMIGLTRIF